MVEVTEGIAVGLASRCDRCAHRCVVPPGAAGRCGAVANQSGALDERWAGLLSVCQVDAVEARPLFHFAPGGRVLVVGGYGCPFTCPYCQNHPAAFGRPPADAEPMPAEMLARRAVDYGAAGISAGVAEPLVLRDYFSATWAAAREAGLFTVAVTNGFTTPETAARLAPLLDAAVVGLKGFSEQTYRRYCGGGLAPVLRTAEAWLDAGVHVELTYLLVPGVSSSGGQPCAFAEWAAGRDADIPVHFTACRPDHLWLGRRAPSAAAVDAAARTARAAGLRFVYAHGGGSARQDTTCPDCGAVLVRRRARRDACPGGELNRWCVGYDVDVNVARGRCPACGTVAPLASPRSRA